MPGSAISRSIASLTRESPASRLSHPLSTARICSAAHGRQVLVSEVTRVIAEPELASETTFLALGRHRLKDLLGAVAVYAAGGYRALTAYGEKKGGEVLRLTSQLRS